MQFKVPPIRSGASLMAVPFRRAGAVVVAGALVAGLLSGNDNASAAEVLDPQLTNSAARPFDMPSTAALRASDKKVFAHYVSWFPRSLDNKDPDYYERNYLDPEGEGGKYIYVGGKMRDRPTERPIRTETNWKLLDMKVDVREAIATGIDGFIISNVQRTGQWADYTDVLFQAAHEVDPGFKILVRPNMISFDSTPKTDLAAYIAKLGNKPSAYRLADGRLVLSPFMAEKWSVSEWKTLFGILKNTYGIEVAFWPMFLNERTWDETFDPISYGMSNWGERSPKANDPTLTHSDSKLGRVAAIHAIGQKWMQPISVTDARPAQGIFDEAENMQNLRNTWEIAIKSNSEAVHIVTWNDYAEGSAFTTSPKHKWSFLDISAYYIAWYKTGKAPALVRDVVYLSHRTQPWAAKPSYPQTKLMALRSGSSPARDTVEALTFLTAPGRVTVKVGTKTHTCDVAAGVQKCVVPLSPGTVSASVTRSGATVASIDSPFKVTNLPYVQDLDYVALSSGRSGFKVATTTTAAPTTTTTTTSSVSPVVITLSPVDDARVEESSPNTNYGSSTVLGSRGETGQRSYLKFDLPTAPQGKTLTKAYLKFRTTDSSDAGSSVGHVIRFAANTWSPSTINWNTQPAIESTPVGSIAADTKPNTAYQTWVSPSGLQTKGDGLVTLVIANTSSTPTSDLFIWSKDHTNSGYRPQLILSYS